MAKFKWNISLLSEQVLSAVPKMLLQLSCKLLGLESIRRTVTSFHFWHLTFSIFRLYYNPISWQNSNPIYHCSINSTRGPRSTLSPPDHWATDSPHTNHSSLTKMVINRGIALPAMQLRMISAKWSTGSLWPLMCMAASTKGVWHGLLLLPCCMGQLVRAGYQVAGTATWRYEHNSDQSESMPSDPYGGQRGVWWSIQCLMLSPPYNSTFYWHDSKEEPQLFQGGQGFLTSPPERGHQGHIWIPLLVIINSSKYRHSLGGKLYSGYWINSKREHSCWWIDLCWLCDCPIIYICMIHVFFLQLEFQFNNKVQDHRILV